MVVELAGSNQCVACGIDIPEGSHICTNCLKKANRSEDTTKCAKELVAEFKKTK